MYSSLITPQILAFYNATIASGYVLNDEQIEAFNDALWLLCNESFDTFEQVSMELGLA